MKPLLPAVVAICLVISSYAHPDNIEEIKELPKSSELKLEAEESEPQARKERCTTCSTGSIKLNLKSPNDVLAALQALPGAEVHTQQSYESCSSDKGCAGLKIKDGAVVERFGNVESFKAAVAANGGDEFQFHPGGALGEGFFNNPPFWWMNQNSPFKTGGGGFEKFSKSSSSFSSSGGAAGAAGAVPFIGAGVDISGNPFLNGEFSKVSGGFASGAGAEAVNKPEGFQSSSFESSSFSSSSKGDLDLSKNPFLNGGIKFGQGGFAAQGGFGSSQFGAGTTGSGATQSQSGFAQNNFNAGSTGAGLSSGNAQFGQSASSSKFGAAGYTGSSPSPFTASTGGSNVNLIQNTQKATEFDYEQQQQQNIDEAFQSTGNVHAHEHGGGGELQQTCAGQGYVCVHKAQCNNGVVNTNGAGVLQAKTQKQYCNIKTEICCRMEISSLSGAGSLQGSLGVGSATYSGSGSGVQGSGLFVAGQADRGSFASGSSNTFGSGQSSTFGQSGQSGQAGQVGQVGQTTQTGQANFGASFGSRGTFGQGSTSQSAFGQGSQTAFGQGSQSTFSQGNKGAFGQGNQGTFGQGTQSTFGQGSQTTLTQGNQGAFGQGTQGTFTQGNQGSQQGAFESSSTGFSTTGTFGSNNQNRGSSSSGFEAGFNANKFASSSGSNSVVGIAGTPAPTNRFGSNNVNNEVYKSTSQSNFVETDSFSAGSEIAGNYRPGGSGSGLKPGMPYLPPDNVNQGTIISPTAIPPTYTPRPTTVRPITKPTYRPVTSTSTSAPGYLPPEQSDSSNQRETRIPGPPTYDEGSLILEQNRPGQRPPIPSPNEIPAGCAAALKCTPIEYCTAEGVISNTTVILTRDQEAYRVPLTDCKDLESGRIGKCCRDPLYTDPWPTNQLGKWVPGVFGGNDGKYVPDSRGSGSGTTGVSVRPFSSGSTNLNTLRQKPTPIPNQVTVGQKGQFEVRGKGQYEQRGQGQYEQRGQGQYEQRGQGQYEQRGQGQYEQRGQGQFGQGSQGQFGQGGQGQIGQGGQRFGVTSQGATQQAIGSQFSTNTQTFKGQGQLTNQGVGLQVSQGEGQLVTQGQGQLVTQGQGQRASQGQGQLVTQGQGQLVTQGQGQLVTQGQGQRVSQGQGQFVTQGQGQLVSQGQGQIVTQGQGQRVSQGQGQIVRQGQGQYAVGGQGELEIQGGGGQTQYSQFSGQSQTKYNQGQGQGVTGGGQGIGIQGQGQGVEAGIGFGLVGQGTAKVTGQGFGLNGGIGTGYRQGFGQGVINGQGIRQQLGQAIVQGEGQTSASEQVYRVFLGPYGGGSGQCGVLNGQKPYGNRNDLEVDFAEIPWQAMVLLQTNRSLLCGGVITRPNVVLTSASCVEGLDAENVLIKGGEWKLGIDDEPLPFQIVQVKTILRHPFFKTGSQKYDAAILVLTENLRLAKNIYPICLPGSSDTLDAFYNGAGECIVTGWGKIVLQAHLEGSIMHSLNVSLINPGECQAKLSSDYPHLLEQYDQESCACGQPLNPVNNVCKVDIGSALACTTDNEHYVLRGIYSWDSGCQTGNQLAAFYKFDLEWYEWAIGLIESVRFAKYTVGTKVTTKVYSGQLNSGSTVKGQYSGAIKGSSISSSGIPGSGIGGSEISGSGNSESGITGSRFSGSGFTKTSSLSGINLSGGLKGNGAGLGQAGNGAITDGGAVSSTGQFDFSQFGSKFGASQFGEAQSNGFNAALTSPITKSFSASFSEKKVFQSEPKYYTFTTKPEIVTYTTKPEIVTFTTKPEYFTYTTKPKIITYTTAPKLVTFTTKPQIIRYETSGSGTNPQYVAPGVTFNPDFSEIAGAHKHNAQCKCIEKGKK